MLKRIGAVLMAGGAAIALIGTGSTSSFANVTPHATTWKVSPGGKVTGSATKPTLKDTKSGTTLTCASSSTTATLKSGSNPIGSISALSFKTCTGPVGLTFTVKLNGLPYKLNANSESSGVVKGTITGIKAVLSGSGCTADVDGTSASSAGQVTGTYTNSTGVLKVSGGNLHIWNVNGCFGLIANGDPSTYSASYKITPKQTITEG